MPGNHTTYKWIVLILMSFVTVWKGILPGCTQLNSDFTNYYAGAKLFSQGQQVSQFYDNDWFLNEANQMDISFAKFTPFPPPTVFIMLPLTSFSPLVAKQIWTVFNILILFGLIGYIKKVTLWSWLHSSLMVLLSGFSLINNFYLGQFYLLLTFLLFVVYYLDKNGKSWGAGSILAIGIIIKYLPFVYVPVFLIKRSKTWWTTFVSVILISGVSLFLLGKSAFTTFFEKVFFAHLDGRIAGQEKSAVAFQSFGSLFSNLTDPQLASKYTLAVVFVIAIVTLGVVIRVLHKNLSVNYLFAITGITAMVILPISASYHFLTLLFPLVLFISQYQKDVITWNPIVLLVLFSVIGWFNIGLTKALWDAQNFLAIVFSYPRLALMLFIWGYMIYLLETIPSNANKVKVAQ